MKFYYTLTWKTSMEVFHLGHFCYCKYIKKDFKRSLLYSRLLWKLYFVNVDLLFLFSDKNVNFTVDRIVLERRLSLQKTYMEVTSTVSGSLLTVPESRLRLLLQLKIKT